MTAGFSSEDGEVIIGLQQPVHLCDDGTIITLVQYWGGDRNFVEIYKNNLSDLIERLQEIVAKDGKA